MNMSLPNYLYRPIQRIPQYMLLIKQIIHYTPENHVDRPNLLQCFENICETLELINERTKVLKIKIENKNKNIEKNKIK